MTPENPDAVRERFRKVVERAYAKPVIVIASAPKARHAVRSDEELLEDTITEAYL